MVLKSFMHFIGFSEENTTENVNKIMIENKNLGIYRLLPGDFKPLSQESISVEDNLLTIRLELVDPNICAGISQLSFVKIEK